MVQVPMKQECIIYWVNLHLRYVFEIIGREYGMGHSCEPINQYLLSQSTNTADCYVIRTKIKFHYLIPFDQINLFSLVSIRTSPVPICCVANFLISLTALGARFLKPMLCKRLCILMVYTLVTTSEASFDLDLLILAILIWFLKHK